MACSSDDPAPTPAGDSGADVGAEVDVVDTISPSQLLDFGVDGRGGQGTDGVTDVGDVRKGLSLSDLAALAPNLGERGQACLACVNDHCSADVEACINDSACVAAMTCMARQCGAADSGPLLACASTCASPAVLMRMLTIYTCSNVSCQSSCQSPDAGTTSSDAAAKPPIGDSTVVPLDIDAASVVPADAPPKDDAAISNDAG